MSGKNDDNGPMRRDIVTGQSHAGEEMLRFVASPDGQLVFDASGKLPGRGLWLWPGSDMLHTARAKGTFAKVMAAGAQKSAKAKLVVADTVEGEIERQLNKRCMASLSMAKRAGQVTAGFEKVRARLKKGNAGLILAAHDGTADGKNKIGALARAVSPETQVVSIFGRDEIASAIGRSEAVHMVLEPGKLAQTMLADAQKLALYTGRNLSAVVNEEETGKT